MPKSATTPISKMTASVEMTYLRDPTPSDVCQFLDDRDLGQVTAGINPALASLAASALYDFSMGFAEGFSSNYTR
jgi:hypothetical protein